MNADAIQQAYESFIETEERRSLQGARSHVYASAWSACTRSMALDMLVPDARPQFPVDTLANFRRGNDRARDLKADMTRVGRLCNPPFDVVGAEERFELRDKKGRVVIVGKVDFRLKFVGQKGSAPVETKSWHPNLIQNVKTFEDLFSNRWTRKGAMQLLSYLLATNEPVGFMLLDRPGIPRSIEVRLFDHLERVEDFLRRAEIAQDAREAVMKAEAIGIDRSMSIVQAALLPPFVDDPSECRSCSFFGSACNPPLSYDGASIITQDEVLAQIEQHETLKPGKGEYDDVHDDLAEYLKRMTPKEFKGRNKKQIIAGAFLIECGWGKNSTLDIPEEEAKRYRTVDEAGRFSFSITRVTD